MCNMCSSLKTPFLENWIKYSYTVIADIYARTNESDVRSRLFTESVVLCSCSFACVKLIANVFDRVNNHDFFIDWMKLRGWEITVYVLQYIGDLTST